MISLKVENGTFDMEAQGDHVNLSSEVALAASEMLEHIREEYGPLIASFTLRQICTELGYKLGGKL